MCWPGWRRNWPPPVNPVRKTAINAVHALARRDDRVVFIGSDLGPDVLADMKHEMPGRFFMEGVAEQAILGMAAGMAMEGLIPYVNTIATFLTRRGLEQVAVDLCLHNLPVRLIANGGGLVYAPLGPTHLAIEDMALMSALPNMAVVAVSDAPEMARLMAASLDWPGPLYIRLAKGGDPVVSSDTDGFAIGQGIIKRPLARVTMVANGIMVARCLKAARILADRGIPCGVINMHTLKPLDGPLLDAAAARADLLVTVEEHVPGGGLGAAVSAWVTRQGRPAPRLLQLSLPDAFPAHYGSQDDLLATCGLVPEELAKAVAEASERSEPGAPAD